MGTLKEVGLVGAGLFGVVWGSSREVLGKFVMTNDQNDHYET